MSDNCHVSSEIASLDNDATISFGASHDATREGVIAYATPENIKVDDHEKEVKVSNILWTLQSFESTDRVDEPTVQAPLALTRQALQHHNSKSIPADGKTMDKYPFGEHHLEPICLGDTAAYVSTLDGHTCLKVHVEPYSYPRQDSKHHFSIALAKMDEQNLDADIGPLSSAVEYQSFHTYPTCIDEVHLYDHLPEPEPYHDLPNTNSSFSESSANDEGSFQVLDLWRIAYAGIGAQFST